MSFFALSLVREQHPPEQPERSVAIHAGPESDPSHVPADNCPGGVGLRGRRRKERVQQDAKILDAL